MHTICASSFDMISTRLEIVHHSMFVNIASHIQQHLVVDVIAELVLRLDVSHRRR